MHFFIYNAYSVHQINRFNLPGIVELHSEDAWIIASLSICLVIEVTILVIVFQVTLALVDFMF